MRNHGASSIYIFLSCVSSLSYSMIFTIELIYQTNVVELNPLQLVLVGSVQQSVNFLLQVPTGILADMYSRRGAVVLGLFLVGAGYFIESLIPTFIAVLVGAGIGGFGATLVNGADAAWIADEMGAEHAGPVYIRAAQVGSITSLLGIAISAGLINVSLNLPIVLGGALFISLGVILTLIMPEHHLTPKRHTSHNTLQQMRQIIYTSLQLIRRRPVLLTILGTGIFYGIFTGGFDRLWPYYLLHHFTFPALGGLTPLVWFCIIEAGIVMTNWLGMEIVRRNVNTDNHYAIAWALFIIDGLQVATIIGFALAGQFFLALAIFLLFTTAAAPRSPLEHAWTLQNSDSGVMATLFSLQGQVSAIAQIIGGPMLGVIATTFSTQTALIVAGFILCPILLLYASTIRSSMPHRSP